MKKLMAMMVLLVVTALFGAPAMQEDCEHECTSWFAFNDVMKNGTVILHKNRDSSSKMVCCLTEKAGASRHWIGLGDSTTSYPCMGMNVSGLLGAMNSGEPCIDNNANTKAKSTPAILQEILSTCDTAAQAVASLNGFLARGDYYHAKAGSIFFFVDAKEAFIVETTAHVASPQRFDHGFAYRANIWHNPDMASYSRVKAKSYLNSCHREYVVRNTLNDFIRKNGCLTIADCLTLSRHHLISPEVTVTGTISNEHTNSACTMELDVSSPDVLSTMWSLVGHPRHTVQIPIPICATSFPESLRTNAWAKTSYQRKAEKGLEAEIPQTWLDFEQTAFAQYREAQKQARELLKQNNKAAAVKLLNETAVAIWAEAAKLLEIQ